MFAVNFSLQGLPSAYLQPSSVYSSHSHTPSQSISHTPSLTHSPSPPPSPPPPHTQTGNLEGDEREKGGQGREEGGNTKKRTSYNPFDSEGTQTSVSKGKNISDRFFSDAGSVEEMKDEEFGTRLDSGSFLTHLAADEAAVQEANKLMLVSVDLHSIVTACLSLPHPLK